jgi:hypothetical protein
MRTIQEIYDEMIAEKQSLTTLNPLLPSTGANFSNLLAELSAQSKVAIWRLILYICAVAIYAHEAIFQVYLNQIQAAASRAVNGTVRWYREEIFKFQFGDVLVWDGTKFTYLVLNPSSQIVAYCSVQEQPDGLVLIKTAKEDNGPAPLSLIELTSLRAYAQQVKFAGTIVEVVSFPADQIRLYYTVYYDPILPLAQVQQAVEENINAYLQNLPFDGRFNVTRMTDSIQTVIGVIDPVFQSAQARYGALPFTAFMVEYLTNSGYLEIDPLTPLATTINYLPYV